MCVRVCVRMFSQISGSGPRDPYVCNNIPAYLRFGARARAGLVCMSWKLRLFVVEGGCENVDKARTF